MHNTKMSLVITLFRILVKGKKHYATPSIDSLIKLLSERHHCFIGRRWIFQCFRDLIDEGFINRQYRYARQDDNSILQIPSLLAFTLKGARLLYSLGVAGAEALMQSIKSWYNKGQNKWPHAEAVVMPSIDLTTKGGIERRIFQLVAGDATMESILEVRRLEALLKSGGKL